MFLKYGQPPGWHYGQWDFRQAYQYYQTEQDKDQEVKFDAQTDGFQTGTVLTTHAWVSAVWLLLLYQVIDISLLYQITIPGWLVVSLCVF